MEPLMLEDFAFNIVIYFFLVTTGIRVVVTAIHVYAGFACSFRDKTVSLCNGTDALGQPIYNTVETLSFYLEGTTLLVFLIVLLLWRSYNYRRLFPCHLCCIPVTYTYSILVAVCMMLKPFCTTHTKVVHTAWKLFIVGYEYELLMYYLAVVALYSLRPAVLRRTIKDYAQHSLKRWLCYVAWCSFLIMSAGHSILLAGYDAMKATSMLHKTHISHTDYDSLSLIVSITTRSLLAKSFLDKLFEWGPGIRSALCEIYSRKPSVRFTCYLSWWSFLSISIVHNAVFAAYTTVIVVSTLTGSRTTFAQIDVVSLLAQFALPWKLTKIFFRKFLG